MAETKPQSVVDVFKENYARSTSLDNLLGNFAQNPNDPQAYDGVVGYIKGATGSDPTFDAVNNQPIDILDRDLIRLATDSRKLYDKRARDYGNENLEGILKSIQPDQLRNLAINVPPKELKDPRYKKHDKMVKVHEKYLDYRTTVSLVASEDPEQRRAGISKMKKSLKEAIVVHLKAKRPEGALKALSDDEVKIFEKSIGYLASKNPNYGVQFMNGAAQAYQAELMEWFADDEGRMKKYILRNMRKTNDQEKDRFYTTLYSGLPKEKKK